MKSRLRWSIRRRNAVCSLFHQGLIRPNQMLLTFAGQVKDRWRIVLFADVPVHLEEGVDQEVAEELRRRGHKVTWPVTGTFFCFFHIHNHYPWWLYGSLEMEPKSTGSKIIGAKIVLY